MYLNAIIPCEVTNKSIDWVDIGSLLISVCAFFVSCYTIYQADKQNFKNRKGIPAFEIQWHEKSMKQELIIKNLGQSPFEITKLQIFDISDRHNPINISKDCNADWFYEYTFAPNQSTSAFTNLRKTTQLKILCTHTTLSKEVTNTCYLR